MRWILIMTASFSGEISIPRLPSRFADRHLHFLRPRPAELRILPSSSNETVFFMSVTCGFPYPASDATAFSISVPARANKRLFSK